MIKYIALLMFICGCVDSRSARDAIRKKYNIDVVCASDGASCNSQSFICSEIRGVRMFFCTGSSFSVTCVEQEASK